MSQKLPGAGDQGGVVQQLIAEYARRTDAGEVLSSAQFIAEHPEHADELRSHFADFSATGHGETSQQRGIAETLAAPGEMPPDASDDPSARTVVRGTADSETSVTRDHHQQNASSATNLEIPETFGRYAIQKVLGQGAMGAVYLAKDTQLDRDVALKIPKFSEGSGVEREELLARFYREARAAATLRSPNICPVYDVGEIDGQHYITMAFIEGRPLKDFTKSKKQHSEKQIITTIRKLALGLAEAHSIGVVHRDLKPANIMVDTKGEPVVMDFGLARRSSSDDVQVTQSGAILGTPAYMAPEQVAGDQSAIDHRVDIYALGIIMYELITNEMPFKGNLMAILQQIALNNPKKPSEIRKDIDPRLEKICLKMMAGDQTKRYQSMQQVAADLQEVLRTPGKRQKQAKQTSPKPTSIPSANEESNPALISIDQPLSIAEQLRQKRGKSPAKSNSKKKTQTNPPLFGLNKNLLIGGGVGGLLLLLGIIFFVRVGKYDVQITLDDPSITLSVDGETLNINNGSDVIKLSAGEHQLQLEKDGLNTHVEEFTVTKDGKTALTAKVVNGKLDALLNGEPPAGSAAEKILPGGSQVRNRSFSTSKPLAERGLVFDSDDTVTVDSLKLDCETPVTIEVWYSNQGTWPGMLVSVPKSDGNGTDMNLGHGNSRQGWTGFLRTTDTYKFFQANSGVVATADNPPTHLAYVRDKDELRIYVDGLLRAKAPIDSELVYGLDQRPVRIGQDASGIIHSVRITRGARYSEKTFTPEQAFTSNEHTLALYHFDEGTGDVLKDASGNGHHGKIIGAKWVKLDSQAAVVDSTSIGDTPPPAIAPFDEAQAKAHQQAWADYLGEPVVTTNSIGMQLAVIPPGKFVMGESGWSVDVTLTKPFRMGVHEVTQGEWKTVMGGDEPWRHQKVIKGDNFPAIMVDWTNATAFCQRLTERERAAGKLRDGWEYRLPTEAEWEYACRAGTTTTYSFDDESLLGEYAWYDLNTKNAGEAYAHAVGLKKPNPWGLYDVHGNVIEWCSDWYGDALTGGTDPTGAAEGSDRALKGGGIITAAEICGSAARGWEKPSGRGESLGFRLALAPVAGTPMKDIGPSVLKTSGNAPPPAVAPFDESQAQGHQQAWAAYLGVPVEYTNSIGMKFRLIPPGEFLMGSTPAQIAAALQLVGEDENWQDKIQSESPQHKVVLTKPVYVGVSEVTQSQYEQIMGKNPSHFAATGAGANAVTELETGNHPVEMVSWNDAADFCAKLSQQEKLRPFDFQSGDSVTSQDANGYRLPTEAEWESACRAGTTTRFWSGDEDQDLAIAGWFQSNSGGRTHSAGELKANPFGLLDVTGNVWEWVQDSWDPAFYGQFNEIAAVDPLAALSAGSKRVIRGGGWGYQQCFCFSSSRFANLPTLRHYYVGFRVVLPVDAVQQALRKQKGINSVSSSGEYAPRWPLKPTSREDIVALQRLKARITLRIGPDQETTLVNSSATIPTEPATVVGISFPQEVLNAPNNLAEICDRVASLQDLEKLVLSFGNGISLPAGVTHDDVMKMAGLPHLQELDLGGIDDVIPRKGFLESFPVLKYLSFAHAGYAHNERGIWEESLARMPRLERLNLYNLKTNDISKLQQASHLTEVLLRGYGDKLDERLSDARTLHAVMPWLRIGVGNDKVETIIEPTAPRPGAQSSHAPPPAVAPFDAAQAKAHQQAWANYLGVPVEKEVELPGGEKIVFMLIPPGEFMMGSGEQEKDDYLAAAEAAEDTWSVRSIQTEHPQQHVKITKPFYLGKFEVTQAQWKSVMGSNPSKFNKDLQNPVETVSWDDIDQFLVQSNTGTASQSFSFALPTQAQWEFACRAGGTTAWHDTESEADFAQVAWHQGNAKGRTHPVGQLHPNAFGLYDMHGNVMEWCSDFLTLEAAQPAVKLDPVGPTTGKQRIRRGGHIYFEPGRCRAAFKTWFTPDGRQDYGGFRLAMTIDAAQLNVSQDEADLDRNVAEWVLSKGGQVESESGQFDTIEQLPNKKFHVKAIRFPGDNETMTPGSMQRLAGLSQLRELRLGAQSLEDADLAVLKSLPALEKLEMAGSKAGYTDAGLEHLKELTHLNWLSVAGTKIGDVGVRHLAGLVNLNFLALSLTRITDDSLPIVAGLPQLSSVHLQANPLTDSGMEQLATSKSLTKISLFHTKITDSGLKHFERMSQLRYLDVSNTAVTSVGVEKLQTVLPDCEIRWDGNSTKTSQSTDAPNPNK